MKSTKTFNNISDKLKAKIPVLKPGETVTFQMLNGVPNPEPDEKERSKSPVLYGKKQLQTNFRIYDPYLTDDAGNEVGGYVDVGCVDQWDKGEPVRFRMFVPGLGQYSQFQGKFALTAGNIKDMELYEILWLSNEREGNPNRDQSVEPVFKIIDLKADSKASITKVAILRKSIGLAENISEEKARQIMASLNQPTYQDKEVLLAKITELAASKPELFIKTYESKETPLKALIKEAIDSQIIDHNIATGDVNLGGIKIHSIKSGTGDVFIEEIVRWINTSENGKDILANIESRMKEAKPATM